MAKPFTTQELLNFIRERFFYDELTGFLYRNGHIKNSYRCNLRSGTLKATGYRHVTINGKEYLEHRIIWLYVHGELPNVIDHIDGNTCNNKLSNLRNVNYTVNMQNRRAPNKHNKSGYLGVSKVGSRWKATIVKDRKSIYLGAFDSPEIAYNAYLTAKRIAHEGCSI